MYIKAVIKRGALLIFAAFFFLTQACTAYPAVPYTGEIAPFRTAAAAEPIPGAAAGIASHHGLASQYIENFYAVLAASNRQARSVILIGPDHYGKVQRTAALCPEDWKYAGQTVCADKAALRVLKGSACLDVRAEPFIMEHSVGLHIPFIKRHFPKASVTSLIVSSKASPQRLSELAASLAALADKNTVIILSMDFSHGKTQKIASAEDDKSVRALADFDFKALPRLDIDASKAAWLFMRTLALTGGTKAYVLERTDSAAIAGDPSIPCTSYAFMVYGKDAGPLVVIDPGHQKHPNFEKEPVGPGAGKLKTKVSAGTRGCVTGLPEYELNLRISLKLEKELKRRGYRVIMTRRSNNVDISNAERAAAANKAKPDVFVRIHANGADDPDIAGAMTICQTKRNPYNGALYAKSKKLAGDILDGLAASAGCKKRRVMETDTMSGINWSKVPAAIVEVGYMTNPAEDRKLSSDVYQRKLAFGIADGIDKYIKGLLTVH